MRRWYVLLLAFAPLLSAKQDFAPALENIIAVEMEFTCERPYVATVRFYNRVNEPLRLQLADVDPAGYWNSYSFKIFTNNDLARRDRINSFHYENRVLEDISVVLPAGGVLQSIINLDEQYYIPKEGFNRIWYTSYWGGVEFADGSIRSIRVESDRMNFDDYCTREPRQ
ncbi:hypothetical protein SAMN05660691_01627 [Rheinheimera pacifica]|uniref:Uncharacterized protein n=1 Tax=Rheinheimera pacifica TaxID=173990 RepID=A0A1H6L617_9GAMM|nr:hypothetical protein [Rheinheimera pacifica]SEH81341.1 hypothetical protein SAMN05660691_01627 [Rheinheimera pacifica]